MICNVKCAVPTLLKRSFSSTIVIRNSVVTTGATSDEVSHFKDLAPTWWDVNGSQAILHRMNLSRLDFIQRTLRNSIPLTSGKPVEEGKEEDIYVPGFNYKEFFPEQVTEAVRDDINDSVNAHLKNMKLTVLDVGCGGGILSESLGRLPFIKHVTGIDLTPECITVAKGHSQLDPMLKGKISYQLKSLESTKGKFDMITCFEMLEHVDQPMEILNHSWKRLNEDGILFLSTINKSLVSWFTTIFVAEDILRLVPRGTHHVNKFVNAKDILRWFQNNRMGEFELLDLKGVMYIPTKGWCEHNCSDVGNYFMAIRKIKTKNNNSV